MEGVSDATSKSSILYMTRFFIFIARCQPGLRLPVATRPSKSVRPLFLLPHACCAGPLSVLKRRHALIAVVYAER